MEKRGTTWERRELSFNQALRTPLELALSQRSIPHGNWKTGAKRANADASYEAGNKPYYARRL